MATIVVDIGGSGIKIGSYDTKTKKTTYLDKLVCNTVVWNDQKEYHHKLEDQLISYLGSKFDPKTVSCIGISTAGNVKDSSDIMRWGQKYGLIHKLNKLNYKTLAINDAEAHTYHCISKYPKDNFPAISVIFGTGIGFTVVDKNGSIIKTEGDHFSLDHVKLDDRNNNNVHSLLGTKSFKRCIKNSKLETYAKNVKRLLLLFAPFFLVKSIFIGGGNSWHKKFKQRVFPEIKNIGTTMGIDIFHIESDAALKGIGYYVETKILSQRF